MKCYKEILFVHSPVISTEKEVSPEVRKFIEKYSENFLYGEFEVDDKILEAVDESYKESLKDKLGNNILKKLRNYVYSN